MKLKNILFAAILPVGAFLASCGGGTDDAKPKPTVTLQSGAGFTSGNVDKYYDSSVKIGIRAFSNDKTLSGVKITLSTNGGTAGTIWDSTFSSKTLNYDRNYVVKGSVGDVLTIAVIATDKNGEVAQTSFNISVIPATVSLSNVANQQVYNVLAPGGSFGAYDLFNSGGVASASTETLKDLKDMTATSGPNIAVFTKTWGSGNGTKFVKVSSNDWANATSSDYIWQLWKTNGASATLTSGVLAKDDVILVKTGQVLAFNIYIIKITQVFETPVPASGGDNNDYIKFDYKGLTK